ncbi:MAG: hypothetical protein IKH03_04735 [Oscillospiraceae bacterium]|nr:hypothetical protein [Oscillospiraceae bacterium]
MKHAKRMTAVLLALLLLAALAVPGMADPSPVTYTPVHFQLTTLDLKETLTAKYKDYKNPDVTYTLTLGDMLVFNSYDYDSYGTGSRYAPSDATITAAKALNKKTLATVTFDANEVPYQPEGSQDYVMSKTKDYVAAEGILAAINALDFDRPCIVYWPVTKTRICDSSDLTNFDHNRATDGTTQTVMILRVDDVGSGVLSPTLSFAAPQEINPTTLMALLEEKYEASGKTTTLTFEEWVEEEYGYDDLDEFFSEYTTNYVQFMDDFGPGYGEELSPNINYANFPYIFKAEDSKVTEFQDEYPATNSLKVEKLVTGNQGKKDQYFKFTVVLGGQSDYSLRGKLDEIASQLEYVTANSVHTATPKYGERFVTYDDTNPSESASRYDNEHPTVRIKKYDNYDDTSVAGDLFYFDELEGGYFKDYIRLDDWIEIDFWLKHGESFEIKNIPANVGFFAAFERPSVEGDMLNNTNADPDYYFDGYTVTTLYSRTETEGPIPELDDTYEDHGGTLEKGAVDLTWSGQQSFSPYTSDDTVTFTNSKDTSTPTGLSLQTAAPIAGAVIALGLGAVLLLSRRRRGSAQ